MLGHPLADLLSLLEACTTPRDRAEAIALVASSSEPGFARALLRTAHLVVRCGARALVRETMSEPVRFRRTSTTRADLADAGRLLTIETGGYEVGHAAFSADGSRIVAFVSGDCGWDATLPRGAGAWLGQWSATTGELLDVVALGQFREESGTFAFDAAETQLAVRSHRSTHIHEVDRATQRVSPRVARVLSSSEGAETLTFVGERRLIAGDGYELLAFDSASGKETARASSIGTLHVASPQLGRVFVGSGLSTACTIASHDIHSLELEGAAIASDAGPTASDRKGVISAMALSPAATQLATGDWGNCVRMWKVRDLVRAGSPKSPVPVRARVVGTHRGWVSALAFVSEARLLSGGWDGGVAEWDLAGKKDPVERFGHHGYITALGIDRDAARALSAGSDGRIVMWDLASGSSPRPPFTMGYGQGSPRIALRVTPGEVRVVVGTDEVVFDAEGRVLRTGRCDLPASGEPRVDVRGFVSNALSMEIAARSDADGPALVVTEGDAIVDVLELEAPACAVAWVDLHTIVVLDAGGHVSFWSLRSGAGTIA